MKSYWKYFKMANEAEGRLKKKYYTWKARRIQDKYTCYMPVSKRISQFKTPHGLNGIIIESGTRIRKGCTICNNVSILTKHGSPEIGRNVYIATGAVIQGGITIGNNCRIGPNKVITKDVPAGTILE